jgi:hypothetical protein
MYISTIEINSENESKDDYDSSSTPRSSAARPTLFHEVNALDESELIEILNRPAAPGVESGSVIREDDPRIFAMSLPSRTSMTGRHVFGLRRSDSSNEV